MIKDESNEEFPNENNELNIQTGKQMSQEEAMIPTETKDNHEEIKLFNPSKTAQNYEAYSEVEEGMIEEYPRERPDLKIKRIKNNWYKHLNKNLNKILKQAKIPMVFKKIPQCVVQDVSIKENHIMLNLTLREMLTKNFELLHKKGKALKKNKSNYDHNKSVFNYLEAKNKVKIYNKLNLGKILNMKMKEIYKEYLASDEFQKSIQKLISEKKQNAYIHYYIQTAKNFIEYYELKAKKFI